MDNNVDWEKIENNNEDRIKKLVYKARDNGDVNIEIELLRVLVDTRMLIEHYKQNC